MAVRLGLGVIYVCLIIIFFYFIRNVVVAFPEEIKKEVYDESVVTATLILDHC